MIRMKEYYCKCGQKFPTIFQDGGHFDGKDRHLILPDDVRKRLGLDEKEKEKDDVLEGGEKRKDDDTTARGR